MALRPWVKKYPKFMCYAMPAIYAPFVFCMIVILLVSAIWDGLAIFARETRGVFSWMREEIQKDREELKARMKSRGEK